MQKEIKTGTTTVGIKGKDCVILAADMRASMGHLAYEEETKKVHKITDNIALTIAGNVGDAFMLIRFLTSQAKLFEIERETKMSVKAMATYLANLLNSNRYFPYITQFIIGGVNEKPELYDVAPYGDILERKRFAVSGSGTELALSYLDSNYKEGMTKQEAVKLAINAIKAAKKRDIYSGGKSISVMVIDSKGAKELTENEIKSYN